MKWISGFSSTDSAVVTVALDPCRGGWARTSEPLKFTSVMLTYFRSFVTEITAATKRMKPHGRHPRMLRRIPSEFAAPYRRSRCDAKGVDGGRKDRIMALARTKTGRRKFHGCCCPTF